MDIYRNNWRSSLNVFIKLSAGQRKQKANLDERLGTILQDVGRVVLFNAENA